MSSIVSFFTWLYGFMKRFLLFLFTWPGQLGVAIGSIIATCYTIFSRFTWLQGATENINTATRTVSALVQNLDHQSPIFSALYSFFAVDSLIQFGAGFITLTVGVLLVLLSGVFLSIVASLPGLFIARATLKLIRVSTGGLIDP